MDDDDPVENGKFEQMLRGQEEPIVNPTAFDRDEVVDQIVEFAVKNAHYWADLEPESTTTIRDRCEGATFSMLVMLDGCDLSMPGFLLSPNVAEEDEEWRIKRGIRFYNPDEFVNSQAEMHDLFYPKLRELEDAKKEKGICPPDEYQDIYKGWLLTSESKIKPLTGQQVMQQIAGAAYDVAEDWALTANLSITERCHGVAHDVLKVLQGNGDDMPAFRLVPITMDGDNRNLPTARDSGVPGDSSSPFRRWPYEDKITVGNNLTNEYARLYDSFRDRLSVSAKDLFD